MGHDDGGDDGVSEVRARGAGVDHWTGSQLWGREGGGTVNITRARQFLYHPTLPKSPRLVRGGKR